MSIELLALITAHFICNAAAEQMALPLHEVRACDQNFTAVKLGFAERVDIETYRRLPLYEQVRLNRIGYARYKNWLQDNPDTARGLKSKVFEHFSSVADGS